MDAALIVAADVLAIALPAALAFVAAIAATVVGYKQWRKQHAFERSKTFLDDRATAYKGLWSRLEAIEVRLREVDVRDEEFDDTVRQLNSYVLLSEIYFDPGIRARVKSYLEAARQVSKLIKPYPPEIQREHAITEKMTIDPQRMLQLHEALKRADEARTAIMTEVRSNLRG